MNLLEPEIVRSPLSREQVQEFLSTKKADMVKVVVDVPRRMLTLGGDLHADGEQVLLDAGSQQDDLWGANIYPAQPHGRQIEYTSLINIRPRQGNRSMDIEDAERRKSVEGVIRALLPLP